MELFKIVAVRCINSYIGINIPNNNYYYNIPI